MNPVGLIDHLLISQTLLALSVWHEGHWEGLALNKNEPIACHSCL